MTSRVPLVATRAVLAPRRSSTAFVATVVPKMKRPMREGSTPWRSRRRSTPASTARAGSSGTEGTLKVAISPVRAFSATKSVKVPPVSTPR